jgi:hypothetical protein
MLPEVGGSQKGPRLIQGGQHTHDKGIVGLAAARRGFVDGDLRMRDTSVTS